MVPHKSPTIVPAGAMAASDAVLPPGLVVVTSDSQIARPLAYEEEVVNLSAAAQTDAQVVGNLLSYHSMLETKSTTDDRIRTMYYELLARPMIKLRLMIVTRPISDEFRRNTQILFLSFLCAEKLLSTLPLMERFHFFWVDHTIRLYELNLSNLVVLSSEIQRIAHSEYVDLYSMAEMVSSLISRIVARFVLLTESSNQNDNQWYFLVWTLCILPSVISSFRVHPYSEIEFLVKDFLRLEVDFVEAKLQWFQTNLFASGQISFAANEHKRIHEVRCLIEDADLLCDLSIVQAEKDFLKYNIRHMLCLITNYCSFDMYSLSRFEIRPTAPRTLNPLLALALSDLSRNVPLIPGSFH